MDSIMDPFQPIHFSLKTKIYFPLWCHWVRQSWRCSNESRTSATTIIPYGLYYPHMLKGQITENSENKSFSLTPSGIKPYRSFRFYVTRFWNIHLWNFFHQELFLWFFNTLSNTIEIPSMFLVLTYFFVISKQANNTKPICMSSYH